MNCCEGANHVFVISSAPWGVEPDWMITCVCGRDGQVLSQAQEFGEVVVSEVDLSESLIGSGLGDFNA